jgi:hypothetical protein
MHARYNRNARDFRCERVILGVRNNASKPRAIPPDGHFAIDCIGSREHGFVVFWYRSTYDEQTERILEIIVLMEHGKKYSLPASRR